MQYFILVLFEFLWLYDVRCMENVYYNYSYLLSGPFFYVLKSVKYIEVLCIIKTMNIHLLISLNCVLIVWLIFMTNQ